MNISKQITWSAVSWPAATAASQYAIFRNANPTPDYTVTVPVGSVPSYTVSYDDAQGVVFVIRPTDGNGKYGPSQAVAISNVPMQNRAWIRTYVRKAMSDRIDLTDNPPTITDDELNDYINDAIRNYSLQFPLERETTVTLIAGGSQAGARSYQLPADYLKIISVLYTQVDSHLQLYLKQMDWKGGETSASSWVGYPKLGIIQPPMSGRFYVGHFDIYEGGIHIDFDPRGNGDSLTIRYGAIYPFPTDDVTPIPIPQDDFEMLTLYVEAKGWLEIEGKDTRLSRWRDKQDGSRRDDMPTEKMSTRMFNAWNQWIRERLNLRPRVYRLMRR